MAAEKFICSQCSYTTRKWLGKCPSCNEWDTLTLYTEEDITTPKKHFSITPASKPEKINTINHINCTRIKSTIKELDVTTGGGFLPGQTILIGGEPGIGKSTLLLQLANAVAQQNHTVLYISSEESLAQIKTRAQRLQIKSDNLFIVNESNSENIAIYFKELQPVIVIVDSIQTTFLPETGGMPGSLSQVRDTGMKLISSAKEYNVILFIIGHITKNGTISGPKVLEHMVDTVLSFECDHTQMYRMLRPIKNRFGPVDELGIFAMSAHGLQPVTNFEQTNPCTAASTYQEGTIISAGIEGKRVFVLELQALVAQTVYGMPERKGVGLEHKKLAIMIAILTKKMKINLLNQDVFVNVIGGIRISDPALDLGFCIAIYSSYNSFQIPKVVSALGEISLNGEIRPVKHLDLRIRELSRRGIDTIYIPNQKLQVTHSTITIKPVHTINQVLQEMFTHENNMYRGGSR